MAFLFLSASTAIRSKTNLNSTNFVPLKSSTVTNLNANFSYSGSVPLQAVIITNIEMFGTQYCVKLVQAWLNDASGAYTNVLPILTITTRMSTQNKLSPLFTLGVGVSAVGKSIVWSHNLIKNVVWSLSNLQTVTNARITTAQTVVATAKIQASALGQGLSSNHLVMVAYGKAQTSASAFRTVTQQIFAQVLGQFTSSNKTKMVLPMQGLTTTSFVSHPSMIAKYFLKAVIYDGVKMTLTPQTSVNILVHVVAAMRAKPYILANYFLTSTTKIAFQLSSNLKSNVAMFVKTAISVSIKSVYSLASQLASYFGLKTFLHTNTTRPGLPPQIVVSLVAPVQQEVAKSCVEF